MTIDKKNEDSKLTIRIEGRLDTTTAPTLEAELMNSCKGITELVIEMEKLEYISSAGLRVLLLAQKMMGKQGSMVVCHPNNDIMGIFEVTGFSDILNIQK